MTTIVANKDMMVADGQGTVDKVVTSANITKMWKVRGWVIGGSGVIANMCYVIEDIKTNKERDVRGVLRNRASDRDSPQNFSLLLLHKEHGLWRYDGFGSPYPVNEDFTAIGSGSTVALAAMMAGATPRKAVDIACKLDIHSGGKIRTYRP